MFIIQINSFVWTFLLASNCFHSRDAAVWDFAVSLVKRLLSHFIILSDSVLKIHRLLKLPLNAGVIHISFQENA